MSTALLETLAELLEREGYAVVSASNGKGRARPRKPRSAWTSS